jgi:phage protein D
MDIFCWCLLITLWITVRVFQNDIGEPVAKVTKYQVDRARKMAQRAALQQKIDVIDGKLATERNPAKKADYKAQQKELQYQKDKIRVRRRNGNGKKKKGIF